MLNKLLTRLFITRSKVLSVNLLLPVLAAWSVAGTVQAGDSALEAFDAEGKTTYIVEFREPALVHFKGMGQLESAGGSRYEATAPQATGDKRLRPHSPAAKAYKSYLDNRFSEFQRQVQQGMGLQIAPQFRYRNLTNGFAARLNAAQAERLRQMPQVKSVARNYIHQPDTDAGPPWIGAEDIWNGAGGIPQTEGEGVVVGIADSGINWDHPSFADVAPDGHNHTNPRNQQFGLCSDAEVLCNDKLIGVYNFTDDDSKGRDEAASSHGTNVASIAAGNRQTVSLNFGGPGNVFTLSGVAPHANVISYKVCREDDPATPQDEDGCSASAIMAALDQAANDEVDVVNLSLGGGARDPWAQGLSGYGRDLLDLREAGIVGVTSASNDGPAPGSIGYPAVAPWVISVAASTHTRGFGAFLQNMSGGVSPPGDLPGDGQTPVNGGSAGFGPARIVHAKDFGNALCGTGTAELRSSCNAHTGSTNPFAPGTFNGEIVVCDRGTYGRIEKSFNVMQAGAGGYILLNTAAQGESTSDDSHCIPGLHFGANVGDQIREWLDSGSNHMAEIGEFGVLNSPQLADQVTGFSSRGPNPIPTGVLKPNVMAPGSSILGAGADDATSFSVLSGTSQASPHIAGSVALLKAANPGWTPSQIQSALELTATTVIASDSDGGPASAFSTGSGRPQLGAAAQAGIFLDVTAADFINANPAQGGDPRTLNLASLTDPGCRGVCTFTRTVTDMQGGGSWNVAVESDAAVTVTPNQFTLGNGSSQTLTITVDVSGLDLVGRWVFGDIVLTSAGAPESRIPLAVFSSGGNLPAEWVISTDDTAGYQDFSLSNLIALPDAMISGAGLVRKSGTTQNLVADPTPGSRYDSTIGTFFVVRTVTADTLMLEAETRSATAPDIDLFIGRDFNGNQQPDAGEELCSSLSPDADEFCQLVRPEPGDYWIMAQNFTASGSAGDDVTLDVAQVDPGDNATLTATGASILGEDDSFLVRVSWDGIKAQQNSEWVGAVAIGTDRNHPQNVGVVPVRFVRNQVSMDSNPLFDERGNAFVIPANASHALTTIDVPEGVTALNVRLSADNAARNDDLKLSLYRVAFADAMASAPEIGALPQGLNALAEVTGTAGSAVVAALSGGVSAGRYYAVAENISGQPVSVTVTPRLTSAGQRLDHHIGWWTDTLGNNQGFEFNRQGNNGFMVWYTYQIGLGISTWYFANAPIPASDNVWTADLLRLTNDGSQQKITVVGTVSLTTVSETEMIMSYRVEGRVGSERVVKLAPNTCPDDDGQKSYTGHWYPGFAGLGGSTVLVNANNQAQVHYLFDSFGWPRWVIGSGEVGPLEQQLPLLEFFNQLGEGPQPTPPVPRSVQVGTVDRSFTDEGEGMQHLQFTWRDSDNDSVDRDFAVVKLSDLQACEQ